MKSILSIGLCCCEKCQEFEIYPDSSRYYDDIIQSTQEECFINVSQWQSYILHITAVVMERAASQSFKQVALSTLTIGWLCIASCLHQQVNQSAFDRMVFNSAKHNHPLNWTVDSKDICNCLIFSSCIRSRGKHSFSNCCWQFSLETAKTVVRWSKVIQRFSH